MATSSRRDADAEPLVNPTVPVGPLKTGPVGVDTAGNVWSIPMNGNPVFVGTLAAGTIPAAAEPAAVEDD